MIVMRGRFAAWEFLALDLDIMVEEVSCLELLVVVTMSEVLITSC